MMRKICSIFPNPRRGISCNARYFHEEKRGVNSGGIIRSTGDG